MAGSPSSPQYQLGVLFVHGIGDQQQGSTLLRWGGAVVNWLDRWLATREPGQEPPVEIVAITPDQARIAGTETSRRHGASESTQRTTSIRPTLRSSKYPRDAADPY